MKKFSVLVLSLCLLTTVHAQHAHLGIKGGVNIANLHYNNNTTTDAKVGLNLGVLAHIHTSSKKWAIQPELLYSLEGANSKIDQEGTAHINLNYLNVPILLQYMFDNGFRLEGGPQIGFLLSAKTKVGDVTVNNKGFQSTAVSIPLGVGYLTSSGFGLDARYVFGLTNINDNKNGPTIQSNVFQLGIFYQFSDPKLHKRG
ncbi:PorT family protein [Ginsengibacter hankyongi]|uniref:PorT family protein n=1 Tax=Ginsengibacter hankyongi TaxID=2607284 RepID=A0A5J5IBM5_9BACT|nr:porin family protein [Ginsengibacter hankyongi]KAA9036337.1 PorT family protein [Ginsengibacter hankyongi]